MSDLTSGANGPAGVLTANFDQPRILDQLVTASSAELDALLFGVVCMDLDGTVRDYKTFETGIAGLSPQTAIGTHFFTEVAP